MMNKEAIEALVEEMARPVAEKNHLELVDVEYIKEGKSWYLRIYIDKDGGVDVEDCRSVSEEMSDLLDQKDPIPTSYFLEVSSPGLERVLRKDRDFVRYRGRDIEVKLYKPLDGQKVFHGRLIGLTDNQVQFVDDTEKERSIPREEIAQVRLYYKF